MLNLEARTIQLQPLAYDVQLAIVRQFIKLPAVATKLA